MLTMTKVESDNGHGFYLRYVYYSLCLSIFCPYGGFEANLLENIFQGEDIQKFCYINNVYFEFFI